jgi:secreted trypsin-like serine protease
MAFAILLFILVEVVYCKETVGDSCTLKPSDSLGRCKLLRDCQQIRDEVLQQQTLPQTCGFHGTQAIVCCPISSQNTRKPGEISKKKCREYSSIARDDSLNNQNECEHKRIKRIVGGILASRKEFPHMVTIGYEEKPDQISWLCAGTLISPQYVLTAGQCLASRSSGFPKYVKMGITNLNDTDHKQQYEIIERIKYPEYQPPSAYHDIGLLKLEKAVTINSFVRPACLYTEAELSSDKLVATGWGRTEFTGPTSEDLLKVTLNVVEHDVCKQHYLKLRKLKNSVMNDIQICAGSTDHKDTCQGDSGGPLQTYHVGDDITCMYDIVGITSFGKSCAVNVPAIYTRISYYVSWIEDIVWRSFVL